MDDHDKRLENEEKLKEARKIQAVQLKKCLAGLAKSKNGKYLLDAICKHANVNALGSSVPAEMLLEKGRKELWLTLIRPNLTDDVRKDIE